MAIQGDFVSKASKRTEQPQTCFKGIFLWPGRRWESFEREKNLQVTQISFVKCFEMALRIAAQILQSNERKKIVLCQFSVGGTKDLIPMGGHGLRVQAQNAANGHQQWIRGSEQMKIQVHHFPHADGVPERLTVPTALQCLSSNQCVNKNRENSDAIFMNYRVQSSLNPTLLRNSALAA